MIVVMKSDATAEQVGVTRMRAVWNSSTSRRFMKWKRSIARNSSTANASIDFRHNSSSGAAQLMRYESCDNGCKILYCLSAA